MSGGPRAIPTMGVVPPGVAAAMPSIAQKTQIALRSGPEAGPIEPFRSATSIGRSGPAPSARLSATIASSPPLPLTVPGSSLPSRTSALSVPSMVDLPITPEKHGRAARKSAHAP